MIAGVVVTLADPLAGRDGLLQQIAAHPAFEVGETGSDTGRIPLTIDVADQETMHKATDWLRDRDEVAFVDVVMVHFEDQDSNASTTRGSLG